MLSPPSPTSALSTSPLPPPMSPASPISSVSSSSSGSANGRFQTQFAKILWGRHGRRERDSVDLSRAAFSASASAYASASLAVPDSTSRPRSPPPSVYDVAAGRDSMSSDDLLIAQTLAGLPPDSPPLAPLAPLAQQTLPAAFDLQRNPARNSFPASHSPASQLRSRAAFQPDGRQPLPGIQRTPSSLSLEPSALNASLSHSSLVLGTNGSDGSLTMDSGSVSNDFDTSSDSDDKGMSDTDSDMNAPTSIQGQIHARVKRAKRFEMEKRYNEARDDVLFVLNNLTRLDDEQDRIAIGRRVLSSLRKLGAADTESMFLFGHALEFGIDGCRPEPFKPRLSDAYRAYLWAAKREHPEAMYRVAVMSERGRGTSVSNAKAIQYLRKASVKHHPGAMHRLGMCLIRGELGLSPRLRDGITWLRMSCRFATPQYCDGLYDYAKLNLSGAGTALLHDDAYAVELLKKGAALGQRNCIYALAEAYDYKLYGLPHNSKLAFEGYLRAAQLGHGEAMFEVAGWILTGAESRDGFEVKQSDAEAYYWIARSAATGFPRAIFGLGHFIHKGIGVPADERKAIQLYHKAAALGDKAAKLKIAELELAYGGALPAPADALAVQTPSSNRLSIALPFTRPVSPKPQTPAKDTSVQPPSPSRPPRQQVKKSETSEGGGCCIVQ
ncbi:hypothetical protein BC831DRAFT_444197 [Entophlyctis helioformis]|nr:hypothetical protein BC831DRAFT_444197 [Entophlyctis helioformis]